MGGHKSLGLEQRGAWAYAQGGSTSDDKEMPRASPTKRPRTHSADGAELFKGPNNVTSHATGLCSPQGTFPISASSSASLEGLVAGRAKAQTWVLWVLGRVPSTPAGTSHDTEF